MLKRVALIVASAASWALAWVGPARAVVIGYPTEPERSSCMPFGCLSAIDRYQQVYSASEFGGPLVIHEIRFPRAVAATLPDDEDFGVPALNSGRFEFHLSTSDREVDSLDPNDLDLNVGADSVLFAALEFHGDPPAEVLVIPGRPFRYDPANGNLLLDIVMSELDRPHTDDGFANAYFDARNGNAGGLFSRAFSRVLPFATGTEGRGLVTEFSSVPEPGSGSLLAGAIGATLLWRARRRNR